MAKDRAAFMGPRLRRLRREMGLTQAVMAEDLGVSPSYIALMERNQRPMTAEMLLKLAQTYQLDVASLAGERGEEFAARLEATLQSTFPGVQKHLLPGLLESEIGRLSRWAETALIPLEEGMQPAESKTSTRWSSSMLTSL